MCFSTTIKPYISQQHHQEMAKTNVEQYSLIDCGDLRRKVSKACRGLIRIPGVYSHTVMDSAGFKYTNNGDAARCHACGLEVSGWTRNMKPFAIHSQQSPACPFVLSILPLRNITAISTTIVCPVTLTSFDEERPYKRLKVDTSIVNTLLNTLVEVDTLKQVRKRTFSHWPHRSSPSSSQMIEAGFFNCNVGDRVICIYCNIICQQWIPNSDDPCTTHKTLSPKCPYVITMLTRSQTSSILVINEHAIIDQLSASISTGPSWCNRVHYTTACNTTYFEKTNRSASFTAWPNENLPPIDDLAMAGFFYTGINTIVTCFYCNGSLQNWGPNDNPAIEHARWFPHCAYAKQVCGAQLYRKIQKSKRAQQEGAKTNGSNNRVGTTGSKSIDQRLLIPDENILSRLVNARLDLPISQSLLDRNFKLSIIKRCWEDQLRLKHEDFVSDCDLLMACKILQKQIECIDGKKENIIVPSIAVTRIRENGEAESHTFEQAVSIFDPCVLCSAEEWCRGIIPCNHPRHQYSFQGSPSSMLNISLED